MGYNYFKNFLSFIDIKRYRKIGAPPKNIFFPVIWITNECNLRCQMCDQWKTNSALIAQELTTEKWRSFIDSVSRMHALAIVITGGEPLLRKDLYDILRHIHKKGIASHLCSNGTLLNESNVNKLKSCGLNSISVSLDSDCAEIHNRMRGADCFDKVISGIKLLKNIAPEIKIGINCVITRQNLHNLDRLIPLAEELGVNQIKFDLVHTNLMHRNKAKDSFKGLIFTRDDLPELTVEIKKLMFASHRSRLLTSPRDFLEGILKLYTDKPCKLPCYAGYVSCAIDALGRVSPCDEFAGVDGLRSDSFERIWHSNSFQELRKKVHSCNCGCWDTTHAEINLRCAGLRWLKEAPRILKEVNFYSS